VQVGHYCIKPKCVVVLKITEGIPEFGLVEILVCINDLVFLVTKKIAVNYFDEHFHAYSVDFMAVANWIVINVANLKDHIPLSILCVLYENKLLKLVSPRYVIL